MLTTSRRRALGVFAIGTLFTLTACSGSDTEKAASGSEGSTAAEPRVIRTDQGEVTVPAAPQRVAVLNYALLAAVMLGLLLMNRGEDRSIQWADTVFERELAR